ncbi:MAG: AI-2E family transporter [Candidatus Gastranaerophilales bacterium]|nr:AI-2E family transporter [Candidatus Gastranaerophilales bacterium]
MNNTNITISTKSIIVFFSFIIGIIFLYLIKDVILLFFASFIIASALVPSVNWISQKIPRGIVVALIYIIGLVLLVTLLIPFIILIITQTREFLDKFPTYWESVLQFLNDIEIQAISMGFSFIPDFEQLISTLNVTWQDIITKSIDITIYIFGGLVAAFTLSVIVMFLLLDGKPLKRAYLNFFPPKHREQAEYITGIITKRVGGYVRGQLALMIAVGVLTTLGLAIIGLDFALVLGIIAGILEIIPIAGPVIASVPGIIIGFAHDPWMGLWATLVYIIVQRIENNLLSPMIMGKFLELHPLIIIAAVLIAASTLGVFGVILSPAIAAVIYVLVQELYLKKIQNET